MASYAKFDVWQNTAGVNRQTILQTVQTVKTDTTGIAVSANTWNEFDSTFRVSITPSSATNKILLSAYISGAQSTGTVRFKFQFSLDNGTTFNDCTPIGNANGSRSRGHFAFALNSDTNQFNTCGMELLHSPSTVNTVVYRIQFGQDISTTYYFNRSINYLDNFLGGTLVSTFLAKEISI